LLNHLFAAADRSTAAASTVLDDGWSGWEARMSGGAAAPSRLEAPPFTDEELDEVARLAVAADPETAVGPDAVSLWDMAGWGQGRLLPDWYMPAPMTGRSSGRWQRWVIGLIVASFLLINAYGLCSTYGRVGFG
jgi:hypothetical protein